MYENILLAYDFDNKFNNVPAELERLTSASDDSQITIFNVISESELETSVRYKNVHFEELVEGKKEQLKPFIDELKSRDLNVSVKFKSGYIKQSILEEINENNYDVIVMSNKRARPNIKMYWVM